MKGGVLVGSVAVGICLLVAFTHAALHRPSGWEVAFDLMLLAVSCTWAIVRVAMGHPELPAVRVGGDTRPSYREADEPEVLVHRIPRATSVYRDAFFVALGAAVFAEVSLAAYAHFRGTDTTLALHVVLAIVLAVLVGFGERRPSRSARGRARSSSEARPPRSPGARRCTWSESREHAGSWRCPTARSCSSPHGSTRVSSS